MKTFHWKLQMFYKVMASNSTMIGEMLKNFSLETLEMLWKNTWNIYVGNVMASNSTMIGEI